MKQMSQYWNPKKVDELEKIRLEKQRLAKKAVPSAFQTVKKVSNLKQEETVVSVNSFNQGLTQSQLSEVQKVTNINGYDMNVSEINQMYSEIMAENTFSTLQNKKRGLADHIISSSIITGTSGETTNGKVQYWTDVIDSTSQKAEPQTQKFQEYTPLEKLVPIIIEPVKMPCMSFLRAVVGSTKYYQREWLIARTFEEFTTMIVDLFGKVDKPTKIPAVISFAYFLDLEKKPFDVKTEVPNYSDEESHVISHKYGSKISSNYVLDSLTDRFYQTTKEKAVKKKAGSNKGELTGLDCAKWLIENNYIPEYVIVHEKNYYNNYEEEIIPLLTEWQHKNNVYSQGERVGSIVNF